MARQAWNPIGRRRFDVLAGLIVQAIQGIFGEPVSLADFAQWDQEQWLERKREKVKRVVGGVAKIKASVQSPAPTTPGQ